MTDHPAQCSRVTDATVDRWIELLNDQLSTLESVRATLRLTRPTRAAKDEMMRRLSGVVARIETLRLALK